MLIVLVQVHVKPEFIEAFKVVSLENASNSVQEAGVARFDVIQQENVQKLVQEVSAGDEESTVIIVTHDVSAAVAVADTIWLMGRERDPQGNIIPGARILEEIDLLKRDLCWHPDIRQRPDYLALVNEIKDRFHTL